MILNPKGWNKISNNGLDTKFIEISNLDGGGNYWSDKLIPPMKILRIEIGGYSCVQELSGFCGC